MRPKENDAVVKEKICNSNLPNGRWKWRSSEAWDESHRPGISLHDLTVWGSKQKWVEGTKQEWVGVDNLKLRMYENSMETTILHANLKIWFFLEVNWTQVPCIDDSLKRHRSLSENLWAWYWMPLYELLWGTFPTTTPIQHRLLPLLGMACHY